MPANFPLAPDAPHGPAIVMRTGEPELVRDAERFGLRSMLCVPLVAGARTLGTITLLSSEHRYGAAELELALEIARRTAAAIEIERSEERYRMLFEASPMPMWVYDADTLAFVRVNDAAIRKYGYSREEFLKMRITDIRPPEDIPAMLADVKARGGPGSPAPKIWRHLTQGRLADRGRDHRGPDHVRGAPGRARAGQRRQRADAARAAARRRGEDGGDRPPRGRRRARLQQPADGDRRLRGDPRSSAPAGSEEAGEIARAAAQAAALTHQLLAFSRRQVLHPKVLDLNEIVAGMETMLHRIIGDDVSVGTRLAPDLAPVEADRAQIERVILNLAANARDAMPGGGALTIETANVDVDEAQVAEHGDGRAGPHVLLAVTDTGHGMDADVTKHLFEPFFTTKAAGAGTGLGLATVFGVVKQSGGGIYVYSEPGRGSTFKIYLPAATAAAEAAEQRARARGRARHGDDHGRRGRRRRARARAADARGQRLRGATRSHDADEAARLCTEQPRATCC